MLYVDEYETSRKAVICEVQAILREEIAHPYWQCVATCFLLPSSIVFWSRWPASDDADYPDFPSNDAVYSSSFQAYLTNCSREVWVTRIARRETALLTYIYGGLNKYTDHLERFNGSQFPNAQFIWRRSF